MTIATLAKLPFRAFDASRWELLRRMARRYGVSPMSMALRAARLHLRDGFSFKEALSSGLLDPAITPDIADGCVSRKKLFDYQARYNPRGWTCLTEDKAVFYAYCKSVGLPVVAPHAIFDRPHGWTSAGVALRTRQDWERFFHDQLPEEFVTKPALGVHGDGVRLYQRLADGRVKAAGEVLPLAQLYDRLQGDLRYTRFVIQQRLRNHPSLIQLSGTDALQTIRFVTWIASDDVRLLAAHLRIVAGDNLIDNFDFGRTGNMLANIGLDDGVLAEAVAVDGMEPQVKSVHPTSGCTIAGFRLPHWPAARELVLRAARLFAPLGTIGWDVAIAPDGPILMEGNAYWDPFNDMRVGPQASPSPQKGLALLMKQFKGISAG